MSNYKIYEDYHGFTVRDMNDNYVFETDTKDKAKEIISALEQQLTDMWIPITEKLPAINQNVLVTCKNMDIAVDFIGEDGQWFWEDGEEGLVTIAWQPLPEPYKEVSE